MSLPPPAKRQKQDEKDEDDEEEQRTFAAGQMLCGYLDHTTLLPDDGDDETTIGRNPATFVIHLLDDDDGDNENNNGNNGENTPLRLRSSWSLDCTRNVMKRISSWMAMEAAEEASLSFLFRQFRMLVGTGGTAGTEMDENDNENEDENDNHVVIWKLLRRPIRSMAHVQLANERIEEAVSTAAAAVAGALQLHSQESTTTKERYQQAYEHVLRALELWPCNPSALICLANLKRMGVVADADVSVQNDKNRLRMVLDLYLAAGKCAFVAREISLALLNMDDDDTSHDEGSRTTTIIISEDDKFLIENIILFLATQVEVEEEEEELDKNGNSSTNDDEKEQKEPGPNDDDDDAQVESPSPPRYSNSKVLVTSSYMAYLMASVLGYHTIAERVLQRFGSSITRIHPAVWETAASTSATTDTSGSGGSSASKKELVCHNKKPTQGAFCPTLFPNSIPQDLFEILRHAFRPNAPYWEQSGYNRNIYYSFWTDWPLPKPTELVKERENSSSSFVVSNAIEHYIVSYLLPRVESVCYLKQNLAGFEWWVHTRPHGANLGHQLHFDTDEALLDQDGTVDTPISASVTYLTLNDTTTTTIRHGATVLFDQTAEATENANVAWIVRPQSKLFLLFPGNLLHGVLPCVTHQNNDYDDQENDNDAGLKSNNEAASVSRQPQETHRLTFMVNFWATRIPDRIKERKLYGPSGPFPPATADHSWVNDITPDIYPQVVEWPAAVPIPCQDGLLSAASPAWDSITQRDGVVDAKGGGTSSGIVDFEWDVSCNTLDVLPSGGINQRFFVKNAPAYFKSTLSEG